MVASGGDLVANPDPVPDSGRGSSPSAPGSLPPAPPAVLPEVLSVDVGYLMGRVAHALGTRELAALHPLGLSLRSYGVLAVTAESPRTQIALAEVTTIDRSSLVSILDDLETAGLVQRQPVPGDRRARLIVATPAGRGLATTAAARVREVEDQALADLDDPARDALLQALRALAAGQLATTADLSHIPSPPRRRPGTGHAG